jgi:peptidoglycan-associated lipoprotein
MKSKAGITIGSLMVVALPLVMAVGCAGNKQKLAQDDAINETTAQEEVMQNEAVQTAIATMDGYMAQLDREQESNAVAETDLTEAVQTEETVAQVEQEPSAEEEILPEVLPAKAAESAVQEVEENLVPEPQQLVFYFDTNSDEPAVSDNATLLQHAAYLQQHPNLVLLISGHADSRGSKEYNERLSAQRAQNVAAILLAAGVSGAQLHIDALGESVPMSDPGHWQENRRVEFTYQDSMVAKK